MQKLQPWIVCVRVNRHDKAYFLHQLDGFSRIDPQLITWDDARPEVERTDGAFVLRTPWAPRWHFPGGHRLLQLWLRLRGAIATDPLGSGPRETQALLELAQTHEPNVIYAHTGFVGLRLVALKERLGVPLVVHFHGLDLNIKDPLYHRILARDLHRFDRIIVVGAWMIAPLVAMGYDPARIDLIPMGTPIKDTVAVPARAAGHCRFVAVGRMIPYKGFDRTIAAFSQLCETYPEATLSLIGDGPQRATLEGQAGQGVQFLGALSSEETLAQVAASDVLLHHALDDPDGPEAFGVVITEAMARGLPVVATRCGGLPDQIVDGETGFLVDQNDVAGMASAMDRLARDPDLRTKLGSAGRVRAVALFDAHDLARRAEDILLVCADTAAS